MLEELKENVCLANIELQRLGLVILTWGNVSGIDREKGLVVIKPSGVAYEKLTPDKMVVLDLQGNAIEGEFQPSSDAPTHLQLYRQWDAIGGICHTHSATATMWAQSCKAIPCFGTTHADYFYGPVPVTDLMTPEQIKQDYEHNTGEVIVACFKDKDPMQIPAVLVANHGPVTWGKDATAAVENALVLEEVAAMALGTVTINPGQSPINKVLLDKHYLRKHGKDAYYGQNNYTGNY